MTALCGTVSIVDTGCCCAEVSIGLCAGLVLGGEVGTEGKAEVDSDGVEADTSCELGCVESSVQAGIEVVAMLLEHNDAGIEDEDDAISEVPPSQGRDPKEKDLSEEADEVSIPGEELLGS